MEGTGAHPLFEHLTKAANSDFTGPIGWNFEKFLVGGDGLTARALASDPRVELVRTRPENVTAEVLGGVDATFFATGPVPAAAEGHAYAVLGGCNGSIMITPAPDFDAQLAWLIEEDAHQDLIDWSGEMCASG